MDYRLLHRSVMREINLAAVTGLLTILFPIQLAMADELNIASYTLASGGVIICTDGLYQLGGTIGQTAYTTMTDGSLHLAGGFWTGGVQRRTADLDGDGDVDLVDFGIFVACVTGTDIPGPPATGCDPVHFKAADFDNDLDVDQSDFGVLQRCYSGSGTPMDVSCME